MRTTLNIDDDVLRAAKEIANLRGTTAGTVLSGLARQALRPEPSDVEQRNGVPLLPVSADAGPVTLEAVNRLRDET